MKKDKKSSPKTLPDSFSRAGASLRQKAEEQLIIRVSAKPALQTAGREADALKLMHELEVHQVELEMQNEELQIALNNAETAMLLFDFAPAGYFTLDHKGIISALNFSGAGMLGSNRSALAGKNFSQIISTETRPVFNDFLKNAFITNARVNCEVRLVTDGKPSIFVHLEGIVSKDEQKCFVIALDMTDRMLAEDALRQSEEKFRYIFENNASAIAIIEPDTTISMVNEAYCRISGYTEAEVIGMSWTQQIPPGDLERLKEYNRRRLINSKDAPNEYEFTFYKKGGEIRQALMSLSVLESSRKIVASFIDITSRLMAENELQKSEQAYRMLVQYLNSGVVVHGPGSEILLANERASVLLGLTIDQMMGKTAIDPAWFFVYGDGTPLPVEEYPVERVLTTKTSIQDLVIGINRPVTNDRVWVLVNAFPEFDTDGQLSQIVVTFVDITARKNIGNKLFQSELKYRKLHESMMDGFIQVTMDGHINDCNESFQKMLGYNCTKLSKLTYLDLTPEKWQNIERKIVSEQVLPYGYSAVYEKEYRKKDGTIFPVELRTFLLKNENGENEGMWAIVRDITERKQAEDGLIKLKNELEISVMAKTKELQERVAELERFHEATINRELRMKELNDEIEQLKRKLY